ncbi:MAG: dihydroxyacetone kinase operon transcriptional regulator DhaR [Anaerolineales bacterium]|jgi:transcriptional activator for dhaKLM operon
MAFRPGGFSLRILTRFGDRQDGKSAWEMFVNRHKLHPGVPRHIANSWARCWSLLDPYQTPSGTRLASDHLLSTQVANFELLLIARPVMEDIYQYIEGSETIVAVINTAGYILDMMGDAEITQRLQKTGVDRGISTAENQIGTNAFALAILERLPVQVSGPEHYLECFHDYAESAAPIFDITGNPLGAIGIINLSEQHHAHSLGLAVAGARAIEGQRQSDHLLNEQNRQLGSLNAILASIDEGILVWNTEGVVIHANLASHQILNLDQENLMGRQIREAVHFPPVVEEALHHQKILSNVEAHLDLDGEVISCIMSLRYIPTVKGISGCIAILRSSKDVRKLIHRQVGSQASFSLDDLVGTSAPMRRVRRAAEVAAAARASILICGESGTGKNLLARAIHNQSPQREGPFLVFACNSIPGELTVSDLVGLDESATGHRTPGRPGKLELADGGTIFFKDVEALSLEAQTILLNALELGIVQRIGSRTPIPVEVRIITSTSADLAQKVADGSFRADLYYRLSPFEIQLPPLRDRMEDLPILTDNILERINRYQPHPYSIAPETLSILRAYRWPGNVRELEAVLERAIAAANDSTFLLPEHLPESIRTPQLQDHLFPTIPSMEEIEREAIIQAAQACKGNLAQMARVLGLGRTTIWRRMKDMEIEVDQFRNS